MDKWMNKFEPIMLLLLKKEVRSGPHDCLNFHMSKLNLDDHKQKVFDALTELHFCDCCNRHQIDKPCIPVRWKSTKTPTQFVIDCVCDCRHTARMICRMCD